MAQLLQISLLASVFLIDLLELGSNIILSSRNLLIHRRANTLKNPSISLPPYVVNTSSWRQLVYLILDSVHSSPSHFIYKAITRPIHIIFCQKRRPNPRGKWASKEKVLRDSTPWVHGQHLGSETIPHLHNLSHFESLPRTVEYFSSIWAVDANGVPFFLSLSTTYTGGKWSPELFIHFKIFTSFGPWGDFSWFEKKSLSKAWHNSCTVKVIIQW